MKLHADYNIMIGVLDKLNEPRRTYININKGDEKKSTVRFYFREKLIMVQELSRRIQEVHFGA